MTIDAPENGEEARRRVRQLLLSGDNTVKNRDDAGRLERARQRYEDARALAVRHGLGEDLVEIIDRRLELLRETAGGVA